MENNNLYKEIEDPFGKLENQEDAVCVGQKRSIWKAIWSEVKNSKVTLICLIILMIIIIMSLMAPLSPYDPNEINLTEKLQGFSKSHWFGTDDYGRDYFTRALYGGRVSLSVGFFSMIVTALFGVAVGVLSGYIGGKFDTLCMRMTDVFLSLPSMLIMVILNAFLKPDLKTLILVLSLFSWPSIARITRAETISLKEQDFVIAAQKLGAGSGWIMMKHIVPNVLGAIIVGASLSIANAILMESSLSFLGLGVQIPQASWGSMLEGAQAHILNAPYLTVLPGLMILITVLSFNLLGDAIRKALEPKIV